MRLSSLVVVLLFCAAPAVASDESFQAALQRGVAAQPSQYSFADLYRVTVGAPATGFLVGPAADTAIRVAATQAPAQFSVADVREPRLGLLLLSGLAAAVWVGRRRLGYGF